MPSDRGTLEDSPGDSLSLKPLISCMMGGGIAISSRVGVGAAGVGVGVGIGVGVGAGKGTDSTTPSSWTVCGEGDGEGDVALGGLFIKDPPCGGEGERE